MCFFFFFFSLFVSLLLFTFSEVIPCKYLCFSYFRYTMDLYSVGCTFFRCSYMYTINVSLRPKVPTSVPVPAGPSKSAGQHALSLSPCILLAVVWAASVKPRNQMTDWLAVLCSLADRMEIS